MSGSFLRNYEFPPSVDIAAHDYDIIEIICWKLVLLIEVGVIAVQ